jgi:hypothetical protein
MTGAAWALNSAQERTAGAPVASFEQDVKRRRLDLLVDKLALSAPVDEVHLDSNE